MDRAGLDVFENEPQVPQELFGLENVVLSPHVGSDTFQTCNAMADLVIANLEAHFLNKPLLTLMKLLLRRITASRFLSIKTSSTLPRLAFSKRNTLLVVH
ncbi:hypothetical protein RIF29_03581 [Crotalaria pallida]|uniref:D-isomer specific 2-hydroxyacid dehydrogenase NAD-binding domain-containing protein n=1 Tax=Crotalaria pallida TaxID=3830 RepID=A0AAN9J0A2_CROPI